MKNVLFIDYTTLLDSNNSLIKTSVMSLKDVVEKVDDIRIVCLNTKQEMQFFKYEELLCELSQALNLKKTLFFSEAIVNNWSTDDSVKTISNWMSSEEVKSFAIVTYGRNDIISKAYPNNSLCCNPGSFSEAHAKNVVWIMSNFKQSISKDENVWFISDNHFSHKNIIKYCNRPWNHGKDENGELIVTDEDVQEMDNEMIRRWNSVVGKNDIVWNLGDFCFGGKENAERIFPQLNGKINLVMGNHDHYKISWYYDLGFHRVYDRHIIIHDFVILSHAPLMFLNNNCPFFNIAGHIHDSTAYQTWTKTQCIVCVERHNYYPVSWKTIKQKYDEMNG